jgi:FkbM family methyltransferase
MNRLAHVTSFLRLGQKLGWSCAFKAFPFNALRVFGVDLPGSLRLRPAGVRYPLRMRLAGHSDYDVLHQIFVMREYQALHNLVEPRLILDCGANVGYSSIYFLNRFPSARVIAVEPDPHNFAVCVSNLKPYGNRAQVIHGAIWPHKAPINLVPAVKGWASRVEHAPLSGSTQVSGFDMPTLLALAGNQAVDLLKIDIERSEIPLFRDAPTTWLDSVKNIVIELHDEECRDVFFAGLAEYDYDLSYFGELTFCRNLSKRSKSRLQMPTSRAAIH